MPRIIAVFLTLCLAGCGLKGSLVLPPGPAPTPLLGDPKPAPVPVKTTPPGDAANGGADVSTDKKNTSE